jgi:nicotinamide-nucleotide amidase
MASDAKLAELVREIARRALAAKLRLVTAESCTGGWIAKVFTDLADSSHWFERGYVTYSNEAKLQNLGVSKETLVAHGAVSEAVVREMALGALRATGADVAVAVSGIAGPSGGTPEKPVGTVWFAVAHRNAAGSAPAPGAAAARAHPAGSPSTADTSDRALRECAAVCRYQLFPGDREAVRRSSVHYALELLLEHALPKPP